MFPIEYASGRIKAHQCADFLAQRGHGPGRERRGANAVSSMEHVDGLLDVATSLARELGMAPEDEQLLACCGELVLEFLYVHNRLSKLTGRGSAGYGR